MRTVRVLIVLQVLLLPVFVLADNGIVTTPIGPAGDVARKVAVQPDGKILVAGYSNNGSDSDFALIRHNADGSLDTSFGGGDGIVTTDIRGGSDSGFGVALKADGKILVGGYVNNGSDYDIALACYNTDGLLDTGFGGGDGTVTTPIGFGNDYCRDIAVQDDGKILAAGYTDNGGNDYVFALLRYNADGSLDTGFGGGDGIVTTDVAAGNEYGMSVAVQPSGKILVTGYGDIGGYDYVIALASYNANGTPDADFGGGDGIVTTDIGGGNEYGYSVAAYYDEKVLVAGYSHNGSSYDFALACYNKDGTLDTGFGGGDGIVTTEVAGPGNDSGYCVHVQADGKILVAGYSDNGTDLDIALARYTTTGTLDTSFSGDGMLTQAIGSLDDVGNGIVVQADGKILVTGYTDNGTDHDFALVRYLDDGTLDAAFGATDNLLMHLKLDDGSGTIAVDETEYHNDGTLNGNAIWTTGQINGGAAFDYTDGEDYIEVPNSATLENVQEGDYSLAAWFKPASTPPGVDGDNDASYGILIKVGWHSGLSYTNENRFVLDHVLTGDTGVQSTSGDTFPPGQFYHVVGVVNRAAGTLDIYVDGQHQDTSMFTPGTAAREYGTNTWKLGIANPGGPSWGWAADGSVDDVQIYGRALSGTEVTALYALGASSRTIAGTVFEDVDFAGVAAAYDGGANDLGLANVDVELYDGADAFVASTMTAGDGSYSFTGLADGTYKVRVRSATIGDADTPPAGGLHPTVPGTWPNPLPEMTWANGAALIGGQNPLVDDTAAGDDGGPGDTWVAVTVSGGGVSGVNLGFSYELIVNQDDDANPDNMRSKQGTLRQFIKNSNAIVGVNKSWFLVSGP